MPGRLGPRRLRLAPGRPPPPHRLRALSHPAPPAAAPWLPHLCACAYCCIFFPHPTPATVLAPSAALVRVCARALGARHAERSSALLCCQRNIRYAQESPRHCLALSLACHHGILSDAVCKPLSRFWLCRSDITAQHCHHHLVFARWTSKVEARDTLLAAT